MTATPTESPRPPAVEGGAPHIAALDGLRGVAILMVLVFHFGGGRQSRHPLIHWLGELQHQGDTGVILFFVLSGFLISGILWDTLREPGALRNFYIRRSLRIMPLYYGSLALIALVALATGQLHEAAHTLWVNGLYLQNIVTGRHPVTYLPPRVPFNIVHFWSLAVEEHFYLVWPFLLLMVRSLRGALRLALAVIAVSLLVQVLALTVCPWLKLCDYKFLANAESLALGGFLFFLHREGRVDLRPYLPSALAVCVAAFLAIGLHHGTLELDTPVREAAGRLAAMGVMGVLLWMCLYPTLVRRFMMPRWLRWVGKVSYGVYMYHLLLLPEFNRLTAILLGRNPSARLELARIPVALSLTFLIAWASFRFLESPILRLKDRLAPRKASA